MPALQIIDNFSGADRYLSNFYLTPVEFEGQTFPSVEHAFQAAKTPSHDERKRMMKLSCADVKRYGRHRVGLPTGWEAKKLGIMEALVQQKFDRNPSLAAQLLATGEAELIEGNTWGDEFWGVCKGRGKNHLGKILMRVRWRLREKHADQAKAVKP